MERTKDKTIKYVYKQYADGQPYGTEIIKVYSTEEKAKARLKKDAENFFKCPWDKIPEKYEFMSDQDFTPTYICYYECDNYGYRFFVVESCVEDEE